VPQTYFLDGYEVALKQRALNQQALADQLDRQARQDNFDNAHALNVRQLDELTRSRDVDDRRMQFAQDQKLRDDKAAGTAYNAEYQHRNPPQMQNVPPNMFQAAGTPSPYGFEPTQQVDPEYEARLKAFMDAPAETKKSILDQQYRIDNAANMNDARLRGLDLRGQGLDSLNQYRGQSLDQRGQAIEQRGQYQDQMVDIRNRGLGIQQQGLNDKNKRFADSMEFRQSKLDQDHDLAERRLKILEQRAAATPTSYSVDQRAAIDQAKTRLSEVEGMIRDEIRLYGTDFEEGRLDTIAELRSRVSEKKQALADLYEGISRSPATAGTSAAPRPKTATETPLIERSASAEPTDAEIDAFLDANPEATYEDFLATRQK
jgi:hypothetical protein